MKILVIGSSNTDMVATTPHLPVPGETVLGGDFIMAAGGKGANQAVAAARLGANTTFIAKLGNDIFGNKVIAGKTCDVKAKRLGEAVENDFQGFVVTGLKEIE